MRRAFLRMAVLAAVFIVPATAIAGIALAPIMGSWSHERRQIDAMLAGKRPYDEAALRQAINVYISDATMVEHHISGGSTAARDFAARFAGFARDGQSALASVHHPAEFKVRFDRMIGDCQSCHAAFNN